MPALNPTGRHLLYLQKMVLNTATGVLDIKYLPIVGFGVSGPDAGKPFVFDDTVMEIVVGESTITVDGGVPQTVDCFSERIVDTHMEFNWVGRNYKTLSINEFQAKMRGAFTP